LRFPRIAEFYYREVLTPYAEKLRKALAEAAAKGELTDAAIVEFPQLLDSAMLLALIWHALFERFEHLDVEGLLRVHSRLIFKTAP